MNELRFEHIVRDLKPDDTKLARDLRAIPPAPANYVIMFSARSGSSWLTSVLSASRRLGLPEEYLNPNHVLGVAQFLNVRTAADLLAMLRRRRKTSNGVFGIEVREVDIRLLGYEDFAAAFDADTLFFHLWRDNIVQQGISLYRAVATGYFHSTSAQPKAPPPPYDAAAIGRWIRDIVATENGNIDMLERLGRVARNLRYEDIVIDRDGTVAMFARALGVTVPPAAAADDAPLKIADDWNTEAEMRYRAECRETLAAIEDERRIRLAAPALARDTSAPEWRAGYAAGHSGLGVRTNPHDAAAPGAHRATWRAGWEQGWRRAPPIDPAASRHVDPLAGAPLANTPAEFIGSIMHDIPGAVHDYAAAMTMALLLDQERRGVAGGLLEIGIRQGRHAALLVDAALRSGDRMLGLDTSRGTGQPLAESHLARHFARDPNRWAIERVELAALSPDDLRTRLGGAARCISIGAEFATAQQLRTVLDLCAALLHHDGVVSLFDYLQPLAMPITDGVHRYLSHAPALAPFGYLPRRLLLARPDRATAWRQTLERCALAEPTVKPPPTTAEFLSRGELAKLTRILADTKMLVLG